MLTNTEFYSKTEVSLELFLCLQDTIRKLEDNKEIR